MTLTGLIVCCVISVNPAIAIQKDAEPELFRVRVDGKYGFIDSHGRVAIAPRFLLAEQFHEGLASVSIDSESYGYIDHAGHFVIQPQFEWARNFACGRAVVSKAGRAFYIDASGSRVVPARYDECRDYSMGVALVARATAVGRLFQLLENHDGNAFYVYIDRDGFECGDPRFNGGRFADNDELLPLRRDGKNGKYEYIGRVDGRTHICAQFDEASAFSEGLASVRCGGNFGYIDRSGNYSIDPMFSSAGPFRDGLAACSQHGLFGYINRQGHWAIPARFVSAGEFVDQRAVVVVKDRRHGSNSSGIIDSSGAFVVPPTLYRIGAISEGMVPFYARAGSRQGGYLSVKGEVVVPARFDFVYPFRGGLGLVMVDEMTGYIRRDGSVAWAPTK